jgi:predicted PurR-regulated permease PerM
VNHRKLQTYFFVGLLLANSIFLAILFYPFIGLLVLAVTFAVIFYPLYQKTLWLVNGQESVASFITTTMLVIMVIVPLVTFGFLIFLETRSLYILIGANSGSFSELLTSASERNVHSLFPTLQFDVERYTRQVLNWMVQKLGDIFSSLTRLLLNLFLSIIALYYLFKEGKRLKRVIIAMSPLPNKYDQEIFNRMSSALTSVIKGSLVISLLQGLSTMVGLIIFGVPSAILWGTAAVVASLVPTIGTALVIAPVVTYLFLIDRVGAAMGMFIWGVTVVGLLDNLLAPKLIERGMHIHPLLILLAVIGGIQLFGPLGFLIGPLFLSLFFALLSIYPLIFPKTDRKLV